MDEDKFGICLLYNGKHIIIGINIMGKVPYTSIQLLVDSVPKMEIPIDVLEKFSTRMFLLPDPIIIKEDSNIQIKLI